MKVEHFQKMNMCQKLTDYKFDKDTTLAILAGFSLTKSFNSRISRNRKINAY